jgi:hypothetical protein
VSSVAAIKTYPHWSRHVINSLEIRAVYRSAHPVGEYRHVGISQARKFQWHAFWIKQFAGVIWTPYPLASSAE